MFCLLLFEGTFTLFFKDKKSKKCHKLVGFKVFRIIIDIIMLIVDLDPVPGGQKTHGSDGSGIGPGTLLPLNSFVGKSSQINLQTSI